MEDLDDLFTDHLNDQLPEHLEIAAATPAPPGLAGRIDELCLSGCTDKIAWSRQGVIAYITKDCREVRTTNLQFRSTDGSWTRNDHTDPSLRESIAKIYKGRQLSYLAWNPCIPNELVVSDAHGRIGIFQSHLAINRFNGVSALSIDPEDSLNALVGLTWLNLKRTTTLGLTALKSKGIWKYNMQAHEPRGPFHPGNKSAFVAVTRGGLVRLVFQVASQQYQEARIDLDGLSTSGDILTHASFCADREDKLLLAVHTYSKQVRLYSIGIIWHVPRPGEQAQINPVMDCQHVAVIDSCCPSDDTPTFFATESGLTHLQLIPRFPDARINPQFKSNPCVLAVFAASPSKLTAGNRDTNSYSIAARWELCEENPALDPSFLQLGSKKVGLRELRAAIILRHLGSIRFDRVILAVQLLHQGVMVALSSCDGGVETRTRELATLGFDQSADRVSGLAQLGFAFSNREPCLHIALSPNSTLKAFLGKDHEISTSSTRLPTELVEFNGIATLDKIAVGFALGNAVAEANAYGGTVNDHMLLTMQRVLHQVNREQRRVILETFLKDLYTIFSLHERLSESLSTVDKTLRTPNATKCLSLQAALGDRGERENRSLMSKVAYTTLAMRNLALSSTIAFAKNPNSSEQEINKPDVLQYLVQFISWFGTLADHICDQLLDLSRTLNVKNSFSLQAVKERVAYLNTPVLHLLLSSFTRSLLRHNCRALRSIAPGIQSKEAQVGGPLFQHYEELKNVFRNNLVTPPAFEALLTESDGIIQKAYEGLDDTKKQEAELSILLLEEVPEVLQGAVHAILTVAVDKLRASLQNPKAESNLAFKDWRSLGLSDDARSKRWRKETTFDALRRIVLPASTKTKICTRCGAATEDLSMQKLFRGGIVFREMLRACFCGGYFALASPPDAE